MTQMPPPRRIDAPRLEALRRTIEARARTVEDLATRLQATCEQVRKGRSRRQILHDSLFARLQARMDSMPVVEQAKGIIMAQQRCGSDEAFDLLRRASQRANLKVQVIAAQVVECVVSTDGGGQVTPSWRGRRNVVDGPWGLDTPDALG